MVSVKSMEEKDDVFLRFFEIPCPKYDKKVNKVMASLFTKAI